MCCAYRLLVLTEYSRRLLRGGVERRCQCAVKVLEHLRRRALIAREEFLREARLEGLPDDGRHLHADGRGKFGGCRRRNRLLPSLKRRQDLGAQSLLEEPRQHAFESRHGGGRRCRRRPCETTLKRRLLRGDLPGRILESCGCRRAAAARSCRSGDGADPRVKSRNGAGEGFFKPFGRALLLLEQTRGELRGARGVRVRCV